MIFSRRPGPDYAAHLTIQAPAKAVYAALATVDGLRGWWTLPATGSAEQDGEFRVEFAGYGIYKVARVEEAVSPAAVRWRVLDCKHADWIGTTIGFELSPAGPDATELRFVHRGLQPALECYESCEAGWDFYLRSLASYAETGTGQPYAS
jgi:uncharacterized protein YndB with AHSA1/START domain